MLLTAGFKGLFSSLLRELVAEMTLADNTQSTWTTSLLPSLCVGVEDSLLGAWLRIRIKLFLNMRCHLHSEILRAGFPKPNQKLLCLCPVSGNLFDLYIKQWLKIL